MAHNEVSGDFLEIQRALLCDRMSAYVQVFSGAGNCHETHLFRLGVKLSFDENAGVQILLGSIAEIFVLF